MSGDETGTLTRTITRELTHPSGMQCLEEIWSGTLTAIDTGAARAVNDAIWTKQEADGARFECGREGFFIAALDTNAQTRKSGPPVVPSQSSGTARFVDVDGIDSGTWHEWGVTIIDHRLVTVPAGTFSATEIVINTIVSDLYAVVKQQFVSAQNGVVLEHITEYEDTEGTILRQNTLTLTAVQRGP